MPGNALAALLTEPPRRPSESAAGFFFSGAFAKSGRGARDGNRGRPTRSSSNPLALAGDGGYLSGTQR